MTDETSGYRITVILPAHGEEDGIEATISEVYSVVRKCGANIEVVVVDDGSSDSTYERVKALTGEYEGLKAIRFSRNFGKEAAILAGLEHATGDAIITMDADLQHPPTLIPEMIRLWQDGAGVVHAVKRSREIDTLVARCRAAVFNKLSGWLGAPDLNNSSDFKLLNGSAARIIARDLRERSRFYRGLATWVGFKQEYVYFDVAPRYQGESKWSLRALAELAVTGIISFTSAPLRIIAFLGAITMFLAFILGVDAVWSWSQGRAVSGFATVIITLLLIGSFTMISLGIIGEYIGKIYDELKGRPSYIEDERCGFNDSEGS